MGIAVKNIKSAVGNAQVRIGRGGRYTADGGCTNLLQAYVVEVEVHGFLHVCGVGVEANVDGSRLVGSELNAAGGELVAFHFGICCQLLGHGSGFGCQSVLHFILFGAYGAYIKRQFVYRAFLYGNEWCEQPVVFRCRRAVYLHELVVVVPIPIGISITDMFGCKQQYFVVGVETGSVGHFERLAYHYLVRCRGHSFVLVVDVRSYVEETFFCLFLCYSVLEWRRCRVVYNFARRHLAHLVFHFCRVYVSVVHSFGGCVPRQRQLVGGTALHQLHVLYLLWRVVPYVYVLYFSLVAIALSVDYDDCKIVQTLRGGNFGNGSLACLRAALHVFHAIYEDFIGKVARQRLSAVGLFGCGKVDFARQLSVCKVGSKVGGSGRNTLCHHFIAHPKTAKFLFVLEFAQHCAGLGLQIYLVNAQSAAPIVERGSPIHCVVVVCRESCRLLIVRFHTR